MMIYKSDLRLEMLAARIDVVRGEENTREGRTWLWIDKGIWH